MLTSKKPYIVLPLIAFCLAGTVSAQTEAKSDANERRIEEQQQEIDALRAELEEFKKQQAAQEAPAAPEKPKPGKFILRKNENLELTFSGRLHRLVLGVDDGANSEEFWTDSEQGPTMLRLDAKGKVNEELSVGGSIEIGIRHNRAFLISQDNPNSGTDLTARVAEVVLDSSRYGKFSAGVGFAAAWMAPEIDLSGTQLASLLPVGMLAPAMKFVDASSGSLSNFQVLNYFADLERMLRGDRVRYDSPVFGPGLQISGSAEKDSRWDLALRYKPEPMGDFRLTAGAAYMHKPFTNVENPYADIASRWDAGASVMHTPSGLNLTLAGSLNELVDGSDVETWVVKGGWLADLNSLGKTAFSVDYSTVSDLRIVGDEATSVGAFVVQHWSDYGIQFYTGYRVYDVSRPDINLKKLHIWALGAVLGF